MSEYRFKKFIEENGGKAVKTPREVDMYDHIDFECEFGETEFSVDVKGQRKRKRHDDEFMDDMTWIEFTNVHGDRGWLQGEADYISFEGVSGFLFVKRDDLLITGSALTGGINPVTLRMRHHRIPYVPYSR
ncbi:MAG: hypothetical protein ACOC44_20255, partial [Promethearchaeia archaeon]